MVASTKDFVEAAAQSDHFEIVEAQTALAQTHDPRVRAFARQMIPAHTETSQVLQQAARRAGLPPPPMSLSGDQQRLLGALQSQRGPRPGSRPSRTSRRSPSNRPMRGRGRTATSGRPRDRPFP